MTSSFQIAAGDGESYPQVVLTPLQAPMSKQLCISCCDPTYASLWPLFTLFTLVHASAYMNSRRGFETVTHNLEALCNSKVRLLMVAARRSLKYRTEFKHAIFGFCRSLGFASLGSCQTNCYGYVRKLHNCR